MNLRAFLDKFVWGFIPSIVLVISYWFAGFMTDDMASLSYSIEKRSVNGLNSFYMQIYNNEDDIAIDEVVISNLPSNILLSSISEGSANTKLHKWSGTIKSGKVVELLIISDKPLPSDKSVISDILKARYQVRDSESGQLTWKKIDISEQGRISWDKSTAYIFWYAAPIILILLFGIIFFKLLPTNGNETVPS
ncbi:hypothetical protein ACK354_09035 [Aeromonas veronii]